jgi:hypothetical protein
VRCEECGAEASIKAQRWRAYRADLIDEADDGKGPDVVFYCPTCADEQFGPPGRPLQTDTPPE